MIPARPGPRHVHHAMFSAKELAAGRSPTTVSVCLPAKDEAKTGGRIVATIRADLIERTDLVDEIVVADDRSTDDTAAVAASAGARVVPVSKSAACQPGKGLAMATALAASTGDLVVFCDADVANFASHFVVGLLGPLLCDPGIGFVKASYVRPLAGVSGEGGRVTELTAKPLLELFHPQLASFVQPLAGEVAVRRPLIESLVLPVDYGVDISLLIDVARRIGVGAMAEVDLGERIQRNRPLAQLVPEARSVVSTILDRAGVVGADAPIHPTRNGPMVQSLWEREQQPSARENGSVGASLGEWERRRPRSAQSQRQYGDPTVFVPPSVRTRR